MDDCIFCKIIRGEIPCHKIYEDESTLAFLDIAKDHYGHTLVIPKSHYTNILDCKISTLCAVMNAVQKISQHYTRDCGFAGVNVLNANGAEANQSVFHLHFHIIPRNDKNEAELFPKQNREVQEDLAITREKLKFHN